MRLGASGGLKLRLTFFGMTDFLKIWRFERVPMSSEEDVDVRDLDLILTCLRTCGLNEEPDDT